MGELFPIIMLRGLVCLHRCGVPREHASSHGGCKLSISELYHSDSLSTGPAAHLFATGSGTGPLEKSSGVF